MPAKKGRRTEVLGFGTNVARSRESAPRGVTYHRRRVAAVPRRHRCAIFQHAISCVSGEAVLNAKGAIRLQRLIDGDVAKWQAFARQELGIELDRMVIAGIILCGLTELQTRSCEVAKPDPRLVDPRLR